MPILRGKSEMCTILTRLLFGLSFCIVVNLPARRSHSVEKSARPHTHVNAFAIVIRRYGNQSETFLRSPHVNNLLVDIFRKFKCGKSSSAIIDCRKVLNECLNATDLFQILGLSEKNRLDEIAFQKAAVVLLKVLLFYPQSCQKIKHDLNYESGFQLELMKYAKPANTHYFTREQLSKLLSELKHRYVGDFLLSQNDHNHNDHEDHDHHHDHSGHEGHDHEHIDHNGHNHTDNNHEGDDHVDRGDHDHADHDHDHDHDHADHGDHDHEKRGTEPECVDDRVLFDDELHAGDHGVGRADLEKLSGLLVAFVAQGSRIGCKAADLPTAHFFIDNLYEKFNQPNGTLSERDFHQLVTTLGIGGKRSVGHNHGSSHKHGHPHPSPFSSSSSSSSSSSHTNEHDPTVQDIRLRAQESSGQDVNSYPLPDYLPYDDYVHGHDYGHDYEHDHDHLHLHSHDPVHVHERERRAAEHDHDHKCFTSGQLMDIFGIFHSIGINKKQFIDICPALVQQVVSHACTAGEPKKEDNKRPKVTKAEAYGYGFLSVAIISMASVCGILLVPCLGKGIYESVISSLICLAIGTMLGDAILHLIPQCLGLHSHEDSDHDHGEESIKDRLREMGYLWKMFTVILALYAFYLLESLFAYLGRRYGDEDEAGDDHGDEGHSHLPDFDATKKLHLKNILRKDSQRSEASEKDENKGRLPPSEYGSMTSMASMDTTGKEYELGITNPALCLSDEGDTANQFVGNNNTDKTNEDAIKVKVREGGEDDKEIPDRNVVLTSHRDLGEGATNAAGSIEMQNIRDGSNGVAAVNSAAATETTPKKEEAHSHAYRNADPELLEQFARKPKGICGIPTVAMLILIGDAIHNFADGIAIGAAFAGDITSGLSTSIAIFMHEVPHEFGDFAVFISSGLSYKKALSLNLVSACTAFLGLFLGVGIASDITVRLWILSVTAGMFLYVSLVDMLPEVMHNKVSKTLRGFCIQNLGIWCGLGLMFLIAIFEDSIQI